MNTQEFKAWFEGFTESMNGVPSKKAWARIKERVAEIQPGQPATPYPVFVDRYWSYPYPYFAPTYTVSSNNIGPCDIGVGSSSINFNSWDAFTALGKADAATLGSSP